jgi:NAD(P)-dependent dehydrogenase (short-subunit alcohol dehydrogenase family)
VDFDDVSSPGQFAELLLQELGDADGPLEVGYVGSARCTWEPVSVELDQEQQGVALDEDSTVLITGGARGITARIALELAKRHRPKLVIVGRSAEPEPEPSNTAHLTGQAEIKAALIARLEKSGDAFTPAKVEELYQRLVRDREIYSNLESLRKTGASVIYRAADVRNESEMAALIEELKSSGGIDGVIHGAGIIDDKLVRDKTPESFDRVFGTKVDSAAILARHLDPQKLKFCAFFASIASRYGNRGQADYAAANEVLSKLAHFLDRTWPGRVFAVAWGPWAEVGMVSHLEKHLVKRGLKLIPPDQGAALFADELEHGRKGESEVLIAGGEEHEIRPKRSGGRQAQAEPIASVEARSK